MRKRETSDNEKGSRDVGRRRRVCRKCCVEVGTDGWVRCWECVGQWEREEDGEGNEGEVEEKGSEKGRRDWDVDRSDAERR